eukprot:scaffold66011_cov54-Phaeocystis_antarctica.AAC.3
MPGLRWGGNRPLSRQCVHLLCVAVAAGAKASATASAERDETDPLVSLSLPQPDSPRLHLPSGTKCGTRPTCAADGGRPALAAAVHTGGDAVFGVQCSVAAARWRRVVA